MEKDLKQLVIQVSKIEKPKKGESSRPSRSIRGFMALPNNVKNQKLDLWKEVKPLEYFLVDVIINETIGWRKTEAVITIEEFTRRSGLVGTTRIYAALRTLEAKKIIKRRKVRHDIYFSLNEEFFGELLIKKHKDAETRRKSFRVVVDNSQKECSNTSQTTSEKDTVYVEIEQKESPKCLETIKEKPVLKTSSKDILIKTPFPDDSELQESFLFEGLSEAEKFKKVISKLEGK